MEAEQRPQDKEPGTPQEELEDEKVPNEEREDRPQGDVGAPQEGGADSPADAGREGG